MALIVFEVYAEGLVHSFVNEVEKDIVGWSNAEDGEDAGIGIVGFVGLDLGEVCFNGGLFCVGDFDNSIDDDLTWSERAWNEHLVINELFVGVIIMGLLKDITLNV